MHFEAVTSVGYTERAMAKKKEMTVAEAGRKGGKARLVKMTAKARRDLGKYAAKVRWDKYREAQKRSA